MIEQERIKMLMDTGKFDFIKDLPSDEIWKMMFFVEFVKGKGIMSYPKFIEVTREYEGEQWPISINVDKIVYFEDHNLITRTDGNTEREYAIWVTESYDEIKALIQDAGCALARRDPRIDDRPLTMEELGQMEGQPVWSGYLEKWQLVHEYRFTAGFAEIVLISARGYTMALDAADLAMYPLYRMKPEA